MTIKLNKEFEYCRPDHIAECSENCPDDLYKLLWNKGVEYQEEQEQKFAKKCGYSNISEWKQAGNTPADYMQEVNISNGLLDLLLLIILGFDLGDLGFPRSFTTFGFGISSST